MGYDISINVKDVDWDKLARYGVPISSIHGRETHSHVDKLEIIELIAGISVVYKKLDQRKKDAVESFLLALQQHYPSFFNKMLEYYPVISKMLPKHITGRHLKLRRLALAAIYKYL